jgi:hypothetical protein
MHAHPQPHIVKKGGKVISITLYKPEDIVPGIESADDLAKAMDFFKHPFVFQRIPPTKHARRWFVVKVRPALRWFCKMYQQDVPPWLNGNGIYDAMSPEERQEIFGQPELTVQEFDDDDAPPPEEEGEEPPK